MVYLSGLYFSDETLHPQAYVVVIYSLLEEVNESHLVQVFSNNLIFYSLVCVFPSFFVEDFQKAKYLLHSFDQENDGLESSEVFI